MPCSAPLYDAASTARDLTAAVWKNTLRSYDNPSFGSKVIWTDFTEPFDGNTSDATATSGWFIQDATAGGTNESMVETASPDGVVTLSATTGTDWFGIEAHYGDSATTRGCVSLITATTNARGRVCYETRVDLNNLDTFFIGLTEPIVEFLGATGALPTSSDYIGFYRTDDGVLKFVMANDNNGGTAVTDEITLLTAAQANALDASSGNWARLAFAVNKDRSIDVAFNGVSYRSLAQTLDPLALPIEALTAKYAALRGATGDRATVSLPIDGLYVHVGV